MAFISKRLNVASISVRADVEDKLSALLSLGWVSLSAEIGWFVLTRFRIFEKMRFYLTNLVLKQTHAQQTVTCD